jgi:hypothetical protein
MTETPERAIELLKTFVDDDPCRLDHHGNCQTHSLGNPCNVAEAREFLASLGEPVSQEAPGQMRGRVDGIECLPRRNLLRRVPRERGNDP